MGTGFAVRVAGRPADYSRQASAAAFRLVDRIEAELSRFVESSDIARANRLPEGGSIVLGEETMRCLLIAMELSEQTERAFDPTYFSIRGAQPRTPLHPTLFALDPASHRLTSLTPSLHLDLGAIGKGYALDRMAEELRDWDVDAALLDGGGSSVLALAGPPGGRDWPVTAGGISLSLAHRAIGASGLGEQGEHIADPRSRSTALRTSRAWALAPSATEADALSTAFFVMSDAEISAFLSAHPSYSAILERPDAPPAILGSLA